MKKSFVVVLLTLVLGAMLVSSVAAAGYASATDPSPGIVPNPTGHAPECKAGRQGANYVIYCLDARADMVSAGVNSMGNPVDYQVKLDGAETQITIRLKSVTGPTSWFVGDAAGNVTSGSVIR